MKIELNDKIPLKRYHHSLIFFDNKLYIIGGLNENKNLINEYHYYNLIKKNGKNTKFKTRKNKTNIIH